MSKITDEIRKKFRTKLTEERDSEFYTEKYFRAFPGYLVRLILIHAKIQNVNQLGP